MQRIGLPENLRANCVLFLDGSVSGTTAYDASGNGNNGTLVNSPTTQRTQGYKGFVFNGSNQTITGSGLPATNIVTMACSVNFNSLSVQQSVMDISSSINGTKEMVIFVLSTGVVRFGTSLQGTGFNYYIDISGLTTGKWYRLMFVMNGVSYSVYIDGVLRGTVTGVSTNIESTYRIAAHLNNGGTNDNFYNGKITNPIIETKAYGATEAYQDFLSFFIP